MPTKCVLSTTGVIVTTLEHGNNFFLFQFEFRCDTKSRTTKNRKSILSQSPRPHSFGTFLENLRKIMKIWELCWCRLGMGLMGNCRQQLEKNDFSRFCFSTFQMNMSWSTEPVKSPKKIKYGVRISEWATTIATSRTQSCATSSRILDGKYCFCFWTIETSA